MKILIACEFSGVVREAFRAKGHDAWSCDLFPTEIEGQHIQDDVLNILDADWDMMIAHPPCTFLCVSGLHWNKKFPERELETERALTFVKTLLEAPIHRIALENPVGCISTRIRKPDQLIQPYQYGHPESKKTCLWLKNLSKLKPTQIMQNPLWVKYSNCDDYFCTLHKKHVADCDCLSFESFIDKGINPYETGGRWSNQTPSGQNKLAPSPERWKERSRTYQNIAEAMAEQWG